MSQPLLFDLPEETTKKLQRAPNVLSSRRMPPQVVQGELQIRIENEDLKLPNNKFESLQDFAENYGISSFLRLDNFRQDADQQEFLEFYFREKPKDCLLDATTGSGKSLMSLIASLNVKGGKTIILVKSLLLAEQFKQEVLRFLNLDQEKVQVLCDSNKKPSARKSIWEDPTIQLIITTYQTAEYDFVGKKEKGQTNPPIVDLDTIGLSLCVLDECHNGFGNNSGAVVFRAAKNSGARRLAMTGSLFTHTKSLSEKRTKLLRSLELSEKDVFITGAPDFSSIIEYKTLNLDEKTTRNLHRLKVVISFTVQSIIESLEEVSCKDLSFDKEIALLRKSFREIDKLQFPSRDQILEIKDLLRPDKEYPKQARTTLNQSLMKLDAVQTLIGYVQTLAHSGQLTFFCQIVDNIYEHFVTSEKRKSNNENYKQESTYNRRKLKYILTQPAFRDIFSLKHMQDFYALLLDVMAKPENYLEVSLKKMLNSCVKQFFKYNEVLEEVKVKELVDLSREILQESDKKILLLTRFVNTAKILHFILSRKLADACIPTEVIVGSDSHTKEQREKQTNDLEKFNKGDLGELLATIAIAGEGISFKELSNAIVFNAPQSGIELLQIVGRTGRKDGIRLGGNIVCLCTNYSRFNEEDKFLKALQEYRQIIESRIPAINRRRA